jgi:hypothetical protein
VLHVAAVTPSFVRASAVRESGNALTTGYGALDTLIGPLRGGRLHTFYGASQFIDELAHRLVVRCSREGLVAYMNNTNYYSEKTLLKADLLAAQAKMEGLEPSSVLDSVYFVAAYSEFRQQKATAALEAAVRREPSTRMILVHNITAFIEGNAKNREAVMGGIHRSVSALWRLAAERDLVMVATAKADALPGITAELAGVLVRVREGSGSPQAWLMKHPERATPAVAQISCGPGGEPEKGADGGEMLMGRVTPPFRQLYQELLERLRRNYLPLLRDPSHRKGFDALLSEAWDREHAAMGNSETPLVLDALNLTANIHNSGAIAELREALLEREKRMEALEERLRRLEVSSLPREG